MAQNGDQYYGMSSDVCFTDFFTDKDLPAERALREVNGDQKLAAIASTLWIPGRTINCKFVDPPSSDQVKQKIMRLAKTYEEYADIDIRFVSSDADAEVRIGFQRERGNSSYIGLDNLHPKVKKERITMSLFGVHDEQDDVEISRIVLHQFGHVLGLVHEHMHDLAWNRDVLYKFCGENFAWDHYKVDLKIINKARLSNPSLNEDRSSIMLYPFGPEFFTNGVGTNINSKLSATDIDLLGKMYPSAVGRGDGFAKYVNPRFNEQPPSRERTDLPVVYEKFNPPHPKPPQVVLGITALEVEAGYKDYRFETSANRVDENGFSLAMETWSDNAVLRSSEVNYIEVPADQVDMEVGRYKFGSLAEKKEEWLLHSTRVRFNNTFRTVPNILLWLTGFDQEDYKGFFSSSLFYNNADPTGFDLCSQNTLKNQTTNAVFCNWIAVSSEKPNVATGRCTYHDKLNQHYSLRIPFPPNKFDSPPKVCIAMSQFEGMAEQSVRTFGWKISAQDITKDDFLWVLEGTGDLSFRWVESDWIAFG